MVPFSRYLVYSTFKQVWSMNFNWKKQNENTTHAYTPHLEMPRKNSTKLHFAQFFKISAPTSLWNPHWSHSKSDQLHTFSPNLKFHQPQSSCGVNCIYENCFFHLFCQPVLFSFHIHHLLPVCYMPSPLLLCIYSPLVLFLFLTSRSCCFFLSLKCWPVSPIYLRAHFTQGTE